MRPFNLSLSNSEQFKNLKFEFSMKVLKLSLRTVNFLSCHADQMCSLATVK